MNQKEKGFLLLSSQLGDPNRKPLTSAQLRDLSRRVSEMDPIRDDSEIQVESLTAIGYGREFSLRVVNLLSEEMALNRYCDEGAKFGCFPLTRISEHYPLMVRRRLGQEAPGCLWAKGDLANLNYPMVSVVGSRELNPENKEFAALAGRIFAEQGITLVSGNARGADRVAQESCLRAGGRVISIVADELWKHAERNRVLYLSENEYDGIFSAQRALSRNRVIHSFGLLTIVVQSSLEIGGTWSGTTLNLKNGWTPVTCYQDGSPACERLLAMGAIPVNKESICSLNELAASSRQMRFKL